MIFWRWKRICCNNLLCVNSFPFLRQIFVDWPLYSELINFDISTLIDVALWAPLGHTVMTKTALVCINPFSQLSFHNDSSQMQWHQDYWELFPCYNDLGGILLHFDTGWLHRWLHGHLLCVPTGNFEGLVHRGSMHLKGWGLDWVSPGPSPFESL